MPCYSPIPLYKSLKGPNPVTGKTPLVSFRDGKGRVNVPCGRCIGCRLERSRQWAIRCDCERQMHENNTFITLTYRDDQLIYGGASHAILYPRHLTLFLKRLRRHFNRPKGIKYFACGEYGDQLGRPHYHALIFGVDFEDKIYRNSKNGHNYYHSPTLDHLWTHGDCIIGDVTFESAAYVARYVLKKKLGKSASEYARDGLEPEFVRMSRRPGIGSSWLEKYEKDVYPNDFMIVRNGIKCRPPKYFNQQFEAKCFDLKNPNYHPMDYQTIVKKRQDAAEKNWQEQEPNRLNAKLKVKYEQIKALKRNLS